MMRLMAHKTVAKVLSIVISLVFIGGIAMMAYTQLSDSTSKEVPDSNIGYFDATKVMSPDNPVYQKAGQEYQDFYQTTVTNAQQDLQAKQDEAAKKKIQDETSQKLQAKEDELKKGLQDKAEEAAKQVGESKGLSVVIEKSSVLYGGVDVTDQVMRKMQDNNK